MQQEWAKHNSRHATLAAGKVTVLKAPCEFDPKGKPKPQTPAPSAQPVQTSFVYWGTTMQSAPARGKQG